MYGSTFKRLRKQQHISLVSASKNICSLAALSRWENNKYDLSFSTVLQLLNRININPIEFIEMCKNNAPNRKINEIYTAYDNHHVFKLKSLVHSSFAYYNQTKKLDDLFTATNAANLYYSLTKQNLLTAAAQYRLFNYLSNVEYWNEENILILSQSILLLEPNITYHLACHIICQMKNIQVITSHNYVLSMETILKIVSELIPTNIDLAKKLLKKIDFLKVDHSNIFFQIKKEILKKIILYYETNNLNSILTSVDFFKSINFFNEVEEIEKLLDKNRVEGD